MNMHPTELDMILLLKSQVEALEKRVQDMQLLMRRPGSEEYEKMVDVVCDHETRLNKLEVGEAPICLDHFGAD